MAESSPQSQWSVGPVQQLLFGCVAVVTIAISAWVVLSQPATGFEVMYDTYPPTFWGLFAAGLLAVMGVLVLTETPESVAVVGGIASLCALYALFNFLPLFRGWALYGRNMADVLAHLGTVNALMQSGQLSDSNFYPFVHVLSAVSARMGLSLRALSSLFSALFVTVYFLGVYLFVHEFTESSRAGVTTLVAAVPLVYGKFEHTFHPAVFSFMLLPLTLYLVERHRRVRAHSYLFFLLALAAGLVLFHPVTSLYLLVILVTSIVARVVYTRLNLGQPAPRHRYLGTELIVLGWTTACWIAWYLRFDFVLNGLVTALSVGNDEAASVAQTYGAERVAGAQSLSQIVVGFVNRYGPIFVLCLIASLATAFVLYRVWRREVSFPRLWLSGQFFVSFLFSSLGVFTYIVAYNPIRNSRFMILFATVFTGVCLASLSLPFDRSDGTASRLAFTAIVLLLAVSVPISAMNTYQPWYHMTYSEEDGTEWVYDHVDADATVVSHHVSSKMQLYLDGSREEERRFAGFGPDGPVPRDFGDQRVPTVGAAISDNHSDVYVVTKEYDLEFYRILRPYLRDRAIVYDETSLRQLEADPTANEIYSNGGYDVWSVNNRTVSAAD